MFIFYNLIKLIKFLKSLSCNKIICFKRNSEEADEVCNLSDVSGKPRFRKVIRRKFLEEKERPFQETFQTRGMCYTDLCITQATLPLLGLPHRSVAIAKKNVCNFVIFNYIY